MGKLFRKIHIDLSLFFLPLALLYALSGALYLSGFNQNSGAKTWVFSLPKMQRDQIPSAINEWLQSNHLKSIDSNQLESGKGDSLMMGGASYSANIKKKGEGFEVEVVQRSFLGNMIMLHKGKAKWYFDILAFGFAFSLIVFYVSGLIMTNFCNKRRMRSFSILGIGFLITFVIGYLSL